jgi:integrative and conjugative element protein (TIGR02256 family)
LRLRWTSPAHIERVRGWLGDNAAGKLHRPDQPLEQIFIDPLAPLILPSDFPLTGPVIPLYISTCERENKQPVFLGRRAPMAGQRPALPIIITAPPGVNTCVRTVPKDLQSLHQLLKQFGIDLIKELSARLRDSNGTQRESVCVVIVIFPVLRERDTQIERHDTWAFAILDTVEKVGEAAGLWQRRGQFVAGLIGQKPSEEALRLLKVIVLNPAPLISRGAAAKFNQSTPSEKRILTIGVGALGSRVLLNCVRAGFGVWTIIDNDFLAPHNVARHELTSAEVGSDKAFALKCRANEIFEGAVQGSYCIDVLRPGEMKAELDGLLADCEVICDMSASLAVSRWLANDCPARSRRVSLFLNPKGDSVIIFGEDSERDLRLDDLEMQYYRHLTTTPDLHNHLSMPVSQIRYARSCRDVTSLISNENVVICSAIASRLLRQILEKQSAVAKIVRLADLDVRVFDVGLSRVETMQIGRWRMRIDKQTIRTMLSHRISRLQNETGGVLIGSVDVSRKLIYVTETLASPADSEEYPTSYIRGVAGLKEKVDTIAQVTDGQLQYIGEWHSHPDHCSTNPSGDDRALFAWLTEHLARDGVPPVMCIVGQHDERWFIETMD